MKRWQTGNSRLPAVNARILAVDKQLAAEPTYYSPLQIGFGDWVYNTAALLLQQSTWYHEVSKYRVAFSVVVEGGGYE